MLPENKQESEITLIKNIDISNSLSDLLNQLTHYLKAQNGLGAWFQKLNNNSPINKLLSLQKDLQQFIDSLPPHQPLNSVNALAQPLKKDAPSSSHVTAQPPPSFVYPAAQPINPSAIPPKQLSRSCIDEIDEDTSDQRQKPPSPKPQQILPPAKVVAKSLSLGLSPVNAPTTVSVPAQPTVAAPAHPTVNAPPDFATLLQAAPSVPRGDRVDAEFSEEKAKLSKPRAYAG